MSEINILLPTVEPINHMGMQPQVRHFHFHITGKIEGKIESCTPSLGRPVELSRFYRQTRDLITCNARPQTPQRHWLALQCNETGYPVKWPPQSLLEPQSDQIYLKKELQRRTGRQDWIFSRHCFLDMCPHATSDVYMIADQWTNVWAPFVCFCQPFWNDDAPFHFLVSRSPSCAVVWYWHNLLFIERISNPRLCLGVTFKGP